MISFGFFEISTKMTAEILSHAPLLPNCSRLGRCIESKSKKDDWFSISLPSQSASSHIDTSFISLSSLRACHKATARQCNQWVVGVAVDETAPSLRKLTLLLIYERRMDAESYFITGCFSSCHRSKPLRSEEIVFMTKKAAPTVKDLPAQQTKQKTEAFPIASANKKRKWRRKNFCGMLNEKFSKKF